MHRASRCLIEKILNEELLEVVNGVVCLSHKREFANMEKAMATPLSFQGMMLCVLSQKIGMGKRDFVWRFEETWGMELDVISPHVLEMLSNSVVITHEKFTFIPGENEILGLFPWDCPGNRVKKSIILEERRNMQVSDGVFATMGHASRMKNDFAFVI